MSCANQTKRLRHGAYPLQTLAAAWFSSRVTYFRDLSPYEYGRRWGGTPGAQNVGWLALGYAFETEQALESDLDLLWAHCKVAIHATRGLHPCEFCSDWSPDGFRMMRNGETLMLGYSEIRVIGPSGQSYAAPSLIYHYVSEHRYKPPNNFLTALRTGPTPPSEAYLEALRTRELEWGSTVR